MKKSVITEELIIRVCELVSHRTPITEIVKELNISRSTVYKIRTSKEFEYITKNYETLLYNKPYMSGGLDNAKKICELLEKGYTNKEIINECKTSYKTINTVRYSERFKELRENYTIPETSIKSLEDKLVHSICKSLEDGYTNIEVALFYGVDKDIISDIRDGTSYRSISKNYKIEKVYKQGKITNDVMEEICKMKLEGKSVIKMSEVLGIGKTAIYRSLKTEKFKYIREKYGIE